MTIRALYLDNTGGRFEARPWEHGDRLHGMLNDAVLRAGGSMRADASDPGVGVDPQQAWIEYVQARNAAVFDRELERSPDLARKIAESGGIRVDDQRADAFSTAGGAVLARDLDYIHRKVLEEKAKPLNAFRMFRTGAGIPLGARTHTVRRFLDNGEAGWYRGSSDQNKQAGYAQKEQTFPVRYVVTSVRTSVFQMMSARMAGINELERKMRSARRAMDQFLNDKLWNGDTAQDYYGVLTYPWLAKKVEAVAFDGSASNANVLAALNSASNYAQEQSGGVFGPNRMVTSIRVRNYLMQTEYSTASDKSIGQKFLDYHPEISRIETAYEMKGIGSSAAVDGILFYNDDADSVVHETMGGLNVLPQQSFGYDNVTHLWMATGGIVMRDAGNNLLLLVTAAS